MKQAILRQLRCISTEDVGGGESLLAVIVDGVPQPSLPWGLDEGQTWAINAAYGYNERLELILGDHNSLDPDEWLGTSALDQAATREGTATFRQAGAHYELDYSVLDEALVPPPPDPAQQAINDFALFGPPGSWPLI